MTDEWITPTEVARRVVAYGYAETMSRQRVCQLADTDPAWPIPREQWRALGRYWLLPWPAIEQYFAHRVTRPGAKRGKAGDLDTGG